MITLPCYFYSRIDGAITDDRYVLFPPPRFTIGVKSGLSSGWHYRHIDTTHPVFDNELSSHADTLVFTKATADIPIECTSTPPANPPRDSTEAKTFTQIGQSYSSTVTFPDADDIRGTFGWVAGYTRGSYDERFNYFHNYWTDYIESPAPVSLGWRQPEGGHRFPLSYKSFSTVVNYDTVTVRVHAHEVELRFGETSFKANVSSFNIQRPDPIGVYAYLRTVAGQVDIGFSDIQADALDQSPGAASFRIIDEYGLRSSWVPFKLAPRAFVEAALTDDGFEANAFKTVDFDHGIAKIEWFYRGISSGLYKNIDITDKATEVRYKTFAFNWEEVHGVDTNQPWSGSPNIFNGEIYDARIYFTQKVTDNAGYTDTFDFSVPYRPQTNRARFIVRPTGEQITRAKHILWQHPKQGRIWSGNPKTGIVAQSDDAGKNWNDMANAWSDVSGAKPLDFEFLGPLGGACSIAKVGTRILFRRSFDNVKWGTVVDVCDAGKTNSWCVRSHAPYGQPTLSIRADETTVRFDSDRLGEEGSWQIVQ